MAKRVAGSRSGKRSKNRASNPAKKRAYASFNLSVAEVYLSYCSRRLAEEYLPMIKKCLEELDDQDIWWRGHETDNSIGNLLLHLSGNIRQWIISGLGGAADERNRPMEFRERRHIPKEELLKLFEGAVHDADKVLKKFDARQILELRHFQKWDATCLDAVSHVVEHVAVHMGQIIYITKLRKGKDLRLVDV